MAVTAPASGAPGRSPLPAGTVTFLFTDVEGSTRLWERFPEAMRGALARHDALIEELTERYGGQVVRPRGEGDSRFCVFQRASDAVAAAAAIQRALHDEPWPPETPIRVRMALHTGEGDLRAGDYYGGAVNRAARLRSLAHGGQTLLSQATHDLVRDSSAASAESGPTQIIDLGEHRLKDLARPERVYQLIAGGVPAEFPPLRSLDTLPNNLPRQATPFIGRERELRAVRELLLGSDAQLVTLLGPGGTGKTRLALQAAADVIEEFPHGVFFVPLEPIADPTLILAAVAKALGIQNMDGRSLPDALSDFLRERRLLLLVDNVEHVLEGVSALGALLRAASSVKALCTSRAPLRLYGEREYHVSPFALPDMEHLPPVSRLAEFEAVQLFAQRAVAVRPDFALTPDNAPAVAEICHRLDGLPLAIELVTARLRVLTPQAILARLGAAHDGGELKERSLSLLTGGAADLPARQQTLRRAIAWSHDLLEEPERVLLRRLSVFAGGWTLEAAESVCECDYDVLEVLESLVAKSLVLQQTDAMGDARFTMLATIREYAQERLEESGEERALRAKHAAYFAAFAERIAPELRGADQARWFDRLETDHSNLRVAVAWSASPEGHVTPGLRIAGVLTHFIVTHGHLGEWRPRVAMLLDHDGARRPSRERARALVAAAALAVWHRDDASVHEAQRLAREAIELCRALDDREGLGDALRHQAHAAHRLGDREAVRELLTEALALAEAANDPVALRWSLEDLGELAADEGDAARAAELYERAIAYARQVGDRHAINTILRSQAELALAQGDPARAPALLRESLLITRDLRDQNCAAFNLAVLSRALAAVGAAEEASLLAGASEGLREAAGVRRHGTVLQADVDSEAYARGQTMAFEEAVAYALDVDPEVWSGSPKASRGAGGRGIGSGSPLTPREREVAALVAQGLTSRQVAGALTITERTAESHVEHILAKLGFRSRAQIAAWAAAQGLLETPPG